VSWRTRLTSYFRVISFAEIAGHIGFTLLCNLCNEGCGLVKQRLAVVF
jgi:hypothetical protein